MKSDNVLIWMMFIAAMLLCVFVVDKKPTGDRHARAVGNHVVAKRDTMHADTVV